MNILLLRHGEAEANFANDEQRHLTARGREDVARAADFITRETMVDHIYVSPYIRARETATIVAERLGDAKRAVPLTLVDDLTPNGNVKTVTDFCNQCVADKPNETSLLLVSHQPLVGELLRYWLGSGSYSMGTSNLANVSFDHGVAAGFGDLQCHMTVRDY